jgi:hypothetical protein
MRSLAVVALILAAALPAAEGVTPGGVSPDGLTRLSVTIQGPSGVGVNTVASFTGRVATLGSAGFPQASVTILRDGTPLATVQTNETGHFVANLSVSAAPGDFRIGASASGNDGTFRGESATILVKVRARPAAPASLSALQDGAKRAVNLSWGPTPDTAGAPLLSYRITRTDASGSAVLGTVNNTTLAFRDANVQWERAYRYFVQAVTFAGTSPPSTIAEVTLVEPTVEVLSASVSRAVLCTPTCDTVPPGSYMTTSNSMRIRPFVTGSARTASGEGVGGVDVALSLAFDAGCAACSPSSGGLDFTARTGVTGAFDRQPAEFSWTDFAPGECRTIRLDVRAEARGVVDTDTASYRVCRS